MQARRYATSQRTLIAGLALGLALTGTVTLAAAAEPGTDAPLSGAGAPAVTLITGDRVTLDWSPDGQPMVGVDPAPRVGRQPTFQVVNHGEQVYVLPSDATRLIPDALDLELFNVAKLVEYGYDDGVPVIVTYDGARPFARTQTTGGADVWAALPSIDGAALTVEPAGRWWQSVTTQARPAGDFLAARTVSTSADPLGSIEKVWLDERVEAVLDESAELVGAPDAWADGYDGTGVTVAVLDTGIDSDHPDLAGKVVASRNFTTSDTDQDRHGHATHVGGIVAGSGAASAGRYKGVAPGASLMSGKVLDDSGNGQTSWVIAGMEWAAAEGADVINMSLGGPPSDGTDPISQAVNALTEQYDALFVIAAGNLGPGDHSVTAPGAADAALTVGSVTKTGQLAGSSGRGPRGGDFAIKPDVTAPGVNIVSARAAGTSMGSPVDDNYTSASGTSMATPHVAGAAAILLQQNPDLTAAELKAALASSATPNPSYDVFQQGAGHINVADALAAEVRAAPASLSFGYFLYPHAEAEPVRADVTYTNLSGETITLDLSLGVRSREGHVAPTEMVSVSPASLTIEPGGEATATVTVDASVGEIGLYGGYLTASQSDEIAASTPVGFYKEPERYELRVEGIARDGRPASVDSQLNIYNVQSLGILFRPIVYFVDGVATLRVPPGTYSVMGSIYTYDEPEQVIQEMSFVGDPEVTVHEDTTLVFDARETHPVQFETPMHPDSEQVNQLSLFYWRWTQQTGPIGFVWVAQAPWDVYVMETEPVTMGPFEFAARWQLGPPIIEMDVVGSHVAIDPHVVFNAPPVDGTQTLRLVNAGLGDPVDYSGIDVSGAAALIRRGETLDLAIREATAAAAGAAALIVANSEPGRITYIMGDDTTIPVIEISESAGDALVDLLEHGDVTIRLSGTATPSYLYDLMVVQHDGTVPAGLHYVAERDKLAEVVTAYHRDDPSARMTELRHVSRPYNASFSFHHRIWRPHERTEYYVGGPDVGYNQSVHIGPNLEFSLEQPLTYREAGSVAERSWYRQIQVPGLAPGGSVSRTGDTLSVQMAEWVDDYGHWGFANPSIDTTAFRLYQNGLLVAEAERPQGSFPLSPEPAEYRLEVDVTRSADWWATSASTRTAWTLRSARPEAGTVALPLLIANYDIDVDVLNTERHPRERKGPNRVGLTVAHQPGADELPIAGARLWISYDDGVTWQERKVRDLGDGHFDAILPARGPDETTGYASLRVEAWDTAGNRLEQEITRAWKLIDR